MAALPGTRDQERSLPELYGDDPERADALVWGRRGALRGAALGAMGTALGVGIPFAARAPRGFVPAALAQPAAGGPQYLEMEGKARLVLLGERPLNAETPEHMLDDEVTPAANLFNRNNGQVPDVVANPMAWTLKVEGEVNTPLELSIGDLPQRFEVVTRRLQIDGGGNGRSFFVPQARGNQWSTGAIANAEWTGVRLRDVLRAAGLKESAKFTGHHGADVHLSGSGEAISRGMRIAKALDEDTLIAFRMNGQPIKGRTQTVAPGVWNPSGYGGNPITRAAILVG